MFLRKVWMSSLLVAVCATVWAKEAEVLEMDAHGEVQIAPDGHVTDYRLNSKLAPAVADLIDRNVRKWRFEPILIDGKAVVAKTSVHLTLNAEQIAGKDDYRLRVAYVHFGDMKLKPSTHMAHPKYPREAVFARVGGKVVVAVRIDATGAVIDAQPYQTSLDARARNEAEAEHYRQLLEKATIEVVRQWSYDSGQIIDGKPVGSTALVPISYFLSECKMPCRPPKTSPDDHKWRALLPGPVHPVPWMNAQVVDSAQLSTLSDDQALSIESPFRLKDDVVGKVL